MYHLTSLYLAMQIVLVFICSRSKITATEVSTTIPKNGGEYSFVHGAQIIVKVQYIGKT